MSTKPATRKRISRPHDLRVVKSRAALGQALLRLIETRALEQITIKDITTEAGVSYPVFFRQFSSKEELLADIAAEEVRNLLAHTYPLFDVAAPSDNLIAFCLVVERRKALWRTLLTTGAASAMRNEFKRIAAEIGNDQHPGDPGVPVELASAFVTSSIFEILTWWLNQPDDYPLEDVASLLDGLVVAPVFRVYGPRSD